MRVKDKIAVVTGAGSGIGRASACALSREGARVVVVDLHEDAARETCEVIRASGGAAFACQADTSTGEGAEEMISRAVREFGSLDVLHNNAGIAVRGTVTEQDEESWDRCVRVNLKTVYLGSKHAIPRMLERGGSIINTSSVTGLIGFRNRAVYAMTKAGIVSLTRSMALDYARSGIRVNCICPGFVRTPLIEQLLQNPEKAKRLTAIHPLGRLGTPEDVAHAVVFLASDESAWMTGQALVVDGGLTAGCAEDI
ncbi:MAG: short-chain dehydrogenase [Acidobacteria bacterium]|nr:MAG: short-chain dehydrogenase [Acidobacteriota bacterium]